MRFSKPSNISNIIRITGTGSQDNILGIFFAGKSTIEKDIKIIEWDFPNIDKSKSRTSKEEILDQLLSGLKSDNQALGTDYKLSKIYFSPSDRASNAV